MKRQERRGVYPVHYDMLLMVPILFLSKIFPNLEGRFDLLFIFKVTFWFLIKTQKLTKVPSDFTSFDTEKEMEKKEEGR